MWVRSGLYIGQPVEGSHAKLVGGINKELISAMRRLPGVSRAMVLWPQSSDEHDTMGIFCQILLEFESKAAMDEMVKSPGREAVRVVRDDLLTLFKGKIVHIAYEVG